MQIDFFQYAVPIPSVPEFGICDDEDKGLKTPAYLSTDKNDRWITTVKSNNRKDYLFIAVDNNIPIKRINKQGKEEDENRCDVILHTSKTICFIELKVDRNKKWLEKALFQLKTTIKTFSENHNIDSFENKRAYAVNSKKGFASSYKGIQQRFYKKHSIVLRINPKWIDELK